MRIPSFIGNQPSPSINKFDNCFVYVFCFVFVFCLCNLSLFYVFLSVFVLLLSLIEVQYSMRCFVV